MYRSALHKMGLLLFLLSANHQVLHCQWTLLNGSYTGIVNVFAFRDTTIFAGTEDGIFVSTNNGKNWVKKNTGLVSTSVSGIEIIGANIFAATSGGAYISTNNGDNWSYKPDLWNSTANSIKHNGQYLFKASTNMGVFRSNNNGDTWEWVNSGMGTSDVKSLAVSGTSIYAGSIIGIHVSTNNGNSWSKVGLDDIVVNKIIITGQYMFALSYASGLFRTTDYGVSWDTLSRSTTLSDIVAVGSYLFRSSSSSGVYQSAINGSNTTQRNEGFALFYNSVYSLGTNNGQLYCGNLGKGIYVRPLSELITSAHIYSDLSDIKYDLLQNFPNPFNPSTTIQYSLPVQSKVKLSIFNSIGQLISVLVDQQQDMGVKSIEWRVPNVASGIYFYRLETVDLANPNNVFKQTKAMILQR